MVSRHNRSAQVAEPATDFVRRRRGTLQIEKLPDRDHQYQIVPAMMSGAKELRWLSETSSQFAELPQLALNAIAVRAGMVNVACPSTTRAV